MADRLEQPQAGIVPDLVQINQLTPDIGSPVAADVGYHIEFAYNQVWPDGQWANDVAVDFTETPKWALQLAAELSGTTLAYIDFYARAVTRIKHSDEVLARSSRFSLGGDGTETVWGMRQRCADTKYLADRGEESGLVFLTEAQILAEDRLRPYMTEWVRALMGNDRIGARVKNTFGPLLDKRLPK